MDEDSPKNFVPQMPGHRHSTIRLPAEAPRGIQSVFDFLVERFPRIDRGTWTERFESGKVFSDGGPLELSTPYEAGLDVHYYREVDREAPVRRDYRVVFDHEDLLVIDKPHHLPVTPAGRWIRNSLLLILEAELGETELAPLHRIDRLSSGLVLFSRRRQSRRSYSRLFQPTIQLTKEYLVVCELRRASFPIRFKLEDHIRRSPEAWYRQEIFPGAPVNARCEIFKIEQQGKLALYRVQSKTGRKHQLRVQLARVGLPILGDPLYGSRPRNDPEDISTRLFLDAHRIEIGDFPPIQGKTWISRETPESFFQEAVSAQATQPRENL